MNQVLISNLAGIFQIKRSPFTDGCLFSPNLEKFPHSINRISPFSSGYPVIQNLRWSIPLYRFIVQSWPLQAFDCPGAIAAILEKTRVGFYFKPDAVTGRVYRGYRPITLSPNMILHETIDENGTPRDPRISLWMPGTTQTYQTGGKLRYLFYQAAVNKKKPIGIAGRSAGSSYKSGGIFV
jgi:hypothetical protein